MSKPSSPKAEKSEKPVTIDTSLESWIYNIRTTLNAPTWLFSTLALLVLGTFVESVPGDTLTFLDNSLGHAALFGFPLIIALYMDWAAGLLTASIALIVFARLKRAEATPFKEGFLYERNDSLQTTKFVSNPHRWFVEQVLGEIPIAAVTDRIQTKRQEDNDSRTSSSSSMETTYTSDGTR
jgi:hypothetical protein